ncbi:MAG: hypothetical protein GYA17_05970 [Chloroflexi bacterium]|nr:hypothetical protein [Chloroflexota bacterium]
MNQTGSDPSCEGGHLLALIRLLDMIRSRRHLSLTEFHRVINEPYNRRLLSDCLPNSEQILQSVQNITARYRIPLVINEWIEKITPAVLFVALSAIGINYIWGKVPWGAGSIYQIAIICFIYLFSSTVFRYWIEKALLSPAFSIVFESIPGLEKNLVDFINQVIQEANQSILDKGLDPGALTTDLYHGDYVGMDVIRKPGWFASTHYKIRLNPFYLAFTSRPKFIKILIPHREKSFLRNSIQVRIYGRLCLIAPEQVVKSSFMEQIKKCIKKEGNASVEIRTTSSSEISDFTIITDAGIWMKYARRKGLFLDYSCQYITNPGEQGEIKEKFQKLWSSSRRIKTALV